MFFTAIHQMMTEGVDLTLVIRKANGQLTVSLLPKSNGLKDEAQNHLVPLTVSGHPQELDAGFLQAVARPIQKTTGLISNMAQFEAQAEKAASESKAAKETKAKETKEEKEKREKYEKHFKKAEELIAAKNHKEAVTALGQARLYAKPQDQKKIDEMVAEQTKEMNNRQPHQSNNRGRLHSILSNRRHRDRWRLRLLADSRDRQPILSNSRQCGHRNNRRRDRHNITPSHNRNPIWDSSQYRNRLHNPHTGDTKISLLPIGSRPAQEPVQHPEELSPHYHAGEDEPNYRPEDYEEYPDFPQSMLENHVSQYQAV